MWILEIGNMVMGVLEKPWRLIVYRLYITRSCESRYNVRSVAVQVM